MGKRLGSCFQIGNIYKQKASEDVKFEAKNTEQRFLPDFTHNSQLGEISGDGPNG